MRIPALVLALILPLIMVFSAALAIQAGIRMDSAEDLKTKDYFQTSAFADSFYSKASTILSGISAREILDKTNEDAYIDLGELYNGDSLSFKNTSGLAYSFNDLKEWSSQSIHSNDDWIVLGLTTPEGETKYMYYSDFKKALQHTHIQGLTKATRTREQTYLSETVKQLLNQFRFIDIVILVSSNLFKVFDSHRKS